MSYLEWESFTYPLELTDTTSEFGYYNIPKNSILRIWRDEQYHLVGEITGTIKHPDELAYKHSEGPLEPG